jgi:hypothetical protein
MISSEREDEKQPRESEKGFRGIFFCTETGGISIILKD